MRWMCRYAQLETLSGHKSNLPLEGGLVEGSTCANVRPGLNAARVGPVGGLANWPAVACKRLEDRLPKGGVSQSALHADGASVILVWWEICSP